MEISCEVSSFLALSLAVQWVVVLFYCRFKFKTRYTIATLLTFMAMFVSLHLAFNCSDMLRHRTDIVAINNADNKILNIAKRSVKVARPEVRELLLNNDQLSHHTVHLDDPQLDDKEYNLVDSENAEELPEGNFPINKEHKQTRADDIEEQLPDSKDIREEPTDNDLKLPANNIEDDQIGNEVDSFSQTPAQDTQEDEVEDNLAEGIYNNVSITVVTMKEYEDIAAQITPRHKQQAHLVEMNTNEAAVAWKKVSGLLPLTPEDALDKFSSFLPWWEQLEILSYPEIYYLGLGASKNSLVDNRTVNFGFDYEPGTENAGMYKVIVGDHLAYRYEVIRILGSGSYGSVVHAYDHESHVFVAVKLMMNENNWSDKYITRELRMIMKIENESTRKNYFPSVIDHFMFRNHKCIVMELLGQSMHRRYRNSVGIKDMDLLRRYTIDLLNGLADLHKINIIHGDLKPDNIMYIYGKNNKSDGQLLKVADFGLGCIQGNTEFKCPVYYLQTRYYRSPEVILSLPFDTAADMWSVGIIVAEFFLGKPPFWGETETDQLAAMMEVLGLIPPYMVEQSPRQKIYRDAICYTTENGFKRKPYRKPLYTVLDEATPQFYDFIKRCLEFEPGKRMTALEALDHPFIKPGAWS